MSYSHTLSVLVTIFLLGCPALHAFAWDILPPRKPFQERLPAETGAPGATVQNVDGITMIVGKTDSFPRPPRVIPAGRSAPIPRIKPWFPTCDVGVPDELCSEYPASWRVIQTAQD